MTQLFRPNVMQLTKSDFVFHNNPWFIFLQKQDIYYYNTAKSSRSFLEAPISVDFKWIWGITFEACKFTKDTCGIQQKTYWNSKVNTHELRFTLAKSVTVIIQSSLYSTLRRCVVKAALWKNCVLYSRGPPTVWMWSSTVMKIKGLSPTYKYWYVWFF